jgi:hypothetical protein
MMVSKVVFVSSTVYDLETERAFLKTVLEQRRRPVRFSTILSEEPSFPITPTDLGTKHSYQICLDKIASADYFVALVKNRYGTSNVEDNGELISITHREYREAYRRRLPIFALVDRRTWNARKRYKEGRSQRFVPAKHLRVFDFIDEISRLPRNNWMYFYRNRLDMKLTLEQVLFNFDDATFGADVTIPDGSIIHTDERFEKVWAIKNTGCVTRKNRYLQEENSGASGLVASTPRIAIPRTAPGETAGLSVKFRAPKYPCTCESYWKMVDPQGRYVFPKKKGVYCRVKVIY